MNLSHDRRHVFGQEINREEPSSSKVRCVTLLPMALAEKLSALLAHLGVSATEFSTATGLSQAYISRIVSGDRGTTSNREPSKLKLAAMRAYGVPDIYWTSPDNRALEEVRANRHTERVTSSASTTVQDVRRFHDGIKLQMAQLAAERGWSGDIVKEIITTVPPDDADPVWWLRRYLDLTGQK